MNVQSFIKWLFQPFLKRRTVNEQHPEMTVDHDKELYTNYIPALHMASSLTIILAASILHFQPQVAYVIILAEVTVLVIELRIRKNEIARALVRMSFLYRYLLFSALSEIYYCHFFPFFVCAPLLSF